MKKIFALIITFITIMTISAACQPTPEEPVVQSKDKDLVQEVIDANEEENAQELTEDKEIIEQQIEAINKHVSMEQQINDRVKIVVDAEVNIPTYDKIPLVRVSPANFTEEHLQRLLGEVAGDNPVYYKTAKGTSIWSKEELQEMLLSLRAYLQNDELDATTKHHLEHSIDFVEGCYKGSINKSEEKPYDGGITAVDNSSLYDTMTHLKIYLGKNQAAKVDMAQSRNNTKCYLQFRNEDYAAGYNTYEPYDGTEAERIDATYDECRNMAEDFVKVLDGPDTNMTLYSSKIGYVIGTFSGYTMETSPQAYSFSFGREYNGVVAKQLGFLQTNDNVDYAKSIQTEAIKVVIDNDGIWSVSWQNYSKKIETVAEDVPLMDFGSINSIFEDYCRYKFTWVKQYDNVPDDAVVTININRVELNLMITPERDDLNNCIMLPVWDFIGDITYDYEQTGDDGEFYSGEENIAILTINSIDGSIIDREQGY